MDGATRTKPAEVRLEAEPALRWQFHGRRRFAWKTAVLLAATLALVPVLLYQSVLGAQAYLAFLVVVHVVGLVTFAWGVRRHHIAPTRRGLVGRIVGLVVALGFLVFAEKGLRTDMGSAVFWWSLFAVWALHTAGLALLHLRSGAEQKSCPFA